MALSPPCKVPDPSVPPTCDPAAATIVRLMPNTARRRPDVLIVVGAPS
jgi:hypothetical protein